MLLHTRHNNNLPSYVAFVDLVKVFDTVNHGMILNIVKRYGAPPMLCPTIEMMNLNPKVVLKGRCLSSGGCLID